MSIQVSNLTKIYGQQKAIDNIYFKIDKAEIVGFLGPNGAGKGSAFFVYSLNENVSFTRSGRN